MVTLNLGGNSIGERQPAGRQAWLSGVARSYSSFVVALAVPM